MSTEILKHFTANTIPGKNTAPIAKGEGIYFWDKNGKKYADFASQTLNLVMGQCYPEIVEAVVEQAKTLTYSSSRFATIPYFKTVEKLLEVAPKGLTHINIKMCDGSDANETAVKTARKYTGKTGIVSFRYGHTGQTTQTIQLRGYDRDPKLLIGNTDDVIFVNPPACKTPGDYMKTIEELQKIMEGNNNIAGLLLDPIMVNAGVLVTEETIDYLHKVEALCRQHNIVFILDENQSFGWLEGIFATKYFGLQPDIITLGKGLAGGYPLAGVIVRENLKDVISYNEADFTNGGNAISCAAAVACITALQTRDFEISRKEKYITEKIKAINTISNMQIRHRSIGLIHCVEIADSTPEENKRIAEQVFNGCLNNGLFLRKYNNHLIIKPPIIVTNEQIDEAFEVLYQQFANEMRPGS